MDTEPAPSGRRERAKRHNAQRIKAAAAELFRERGYEAVTTQAIADRADVAAGTVFRYARTKPELLVMVYNDVFRAGVEEGAAAAVDGAILDRLLALHAPIVDACAREPENVTVFLREILFAPEASDHLDVALGQAERLEGLTVQLLRDGQERGEVRAGVDLETASRNIFSLFYVTLVRATLGRAAGREVAAQLRAAIALQIDGLRG